MSDRPARRTHYEVTYLDTEDHNTYRGGRQQSIDEAFALARHYVKVGFAHVQVEEIVTTVWNVG